MQKRLLYVAGLLGILLLGGCSGKTASMMPIRFDSYAMKRYTDGKIYQQSDAPVSTSMTMVYQAVQQGTGTANSLIVAKAGVSSGVSVEEITELNIQQIQQKLLNYKWTAPKISRITCDDISLTWYYFSFSYDLGEDQHFSVFQYLFQTGTVLYMISLQSKDAKDIWVMPRSIKTIACK